ncbi:MAG: glycosyltransferase family 4 protein [Gemmatimonadota bacterium]
MSRIAVLGSFADSLIIFRGLLLERLRAQGHEVMALAPEAPPRIREALEDMGVVFTEVPLERTGLNPFQDLETRRFLTDEFERFKPHLLLSYTIKPVIYGSMAARKAGVPAIYSMITGAGFGFGGSRKEKALSPVIRRMYRSALSANRAVFFQNPDDRALFLRNGLVRPEQVVLIPGSGVDLEAFTPVPFPKDPPLVFLLIARLLREKGIEEYADAARLLRSRYSDVRFVLVGPLDDHPDGITREEVRKWEVEGVLEYKGHQEDVRPFIADASVYVLPSYREGTPRSVLEAMAMGRPIITTDVPGCRETVRPWVNGFLVPPRDPLGLALAMERFLRRPELVPAMGRRSREEAEARFDVHVVNDIILDTLGLADEGPNGQSNGPPHALSAGGDAA